MYSHIYSGRKRPVVTAGIWAIEKDDAVKGEPFSEKLRKTSFKIYLNAIVNTNIIDHLKSVCITFDKEHEPQIRFKCTRKYLLMRRGSKLLCFPSYEPST